MNFMIQNNIGKCYLIVQRYKDIHLYFKITKGSYDLYYVMHFNVRILLHEPVVYVLLIVVMSVKNIKNLNPMSYLFIDCKKNI